MLLELTPFKEHPSTDTDTYAELRNLRHLVLDTRNVISAMSLTPLWSGIIALTRRSNAPLSSLTLQLAERKGPDPVFIEELLDAHASTLTELRFKNCNITYESLSQICQRCHDLEVLQVPINLKILVRVLSSNTSSELQLTCFCSLHLSKHWSIRVP